jgi:hypothetical protein
LVSAAIFLGCRNACRAFTVAKPATTHLAAQWVIDPTLIVAVLTGFVLIHFHLLFVPIRPV